MVFRPGAHCRLQAKRVLMGTIAAARWISAPSASGSVCVARTARVTRGAGKEAAAARAQQNKESELLGTKLYTQRASFGGISPMPNRSE